MSTSEDVRPLLFDRLDSIRALLSLGAMGKESFWDQTHQRLATLLGCSEADAAIIVRDLWRYGDICVRPEEDLLRWERQE